MHKVRFAVILLLVIMVQLTPIQAEEHSPAIAPPSGLNTGIQIQNVGTASSEVVISGYDRLTGLPGGSMTADSIAAGSSANATNFPQNGQPFDGSALTNASQPIIGMVSINNTPGGVAAAQFQATNRNQASSLLRFPLVKNNFNGKCTLFYIQNIGSNVTTISLSYSNGSTQQFSNIKIGQTVMVDPSMASPPIPTTAPYAMTASAGQLLAGATLEFSCINSNTLQATRAFSASDADDTLFAPIYKNKFPAAGARNNGLQVQNVSGGVADIVATFICSAGNCSQGSFYTHIATDVPSGSSATFFNNTVISSGSTKPAAEPLPSNALFAVIVEGFVANTSTPLDIVGLVSESFDPSVPIRNTATTYGAIAFSQGSSKLGIPLYKEMFLNNTSGIQIQNVGLSSTTVSVNFIMNNAQSGALCKGSYLLSNINILSGASVTLTRLGSGGTIPAGATWGGSGPVRAGCFGNATITASGGGLLAAIIQETDNNPNPALRLDNRNYEAFPLLPSLQSQVAIPVLVDQ